ncbi:MAG: serine/threonine-protein kinase [Isosphaeraceae bacterium]
MRLCPGCLLALGLDLPERPQESDDSPTLLEEIGRGGMAVVYRGFDANLRRELAVKLIQDRHVDRPEMLEQFLREARIVGSLQHPGIVPVYALGTLPDGRPYFTMRMVEGHTLAELLAREGDAAPGLGRLIPLLLQIAQTLAYAHDHGVVHGDLTPANVMLGRFGEVQILDWGLARVVAEEGDPAVGAAGTPGYLAPERAAGTGGRWNARSDVFALGSILCEILTGAPAYPWSLSAREAGRSPVPDVTGGLSRLASCGADPELVSLARDCLAVDPASRPANASVFARRLSAHIEGAAERLRAAEISRAEAVAVAREEKRRRRLLAGFAASAACLVALIGYVVSERSRRIELRRASAEKAIREGEVLRDAAAADPSGDPEAWRTALEAVGRVTPLVADAPEETRRRLASLTESVRQRLDAATRDRRTAEKLERIRHRAEQGEHEAADEEYRAAFLEAGLDVLNGSPADVGRAVRERPRDVAAALIAALDDWAIVRTQQARVGLSTPAAATLPRETARAADADPWRDQIRVALQSGDNRALVGFAKAPDATTRPVASIWLLGRALVWTGQVGEAGKFLAAAWQAHPHDFWINYDLSVAHSVPPGRFEDAITFASTAVALRPESAVAHLRLASARACFTDKFDCVPEYQAAIRLAPDYYPARIGFGSKLLVMEWLTEAAEEFRQATRLLPRVRPVHPGISRPEADPGYAEDHSYFPWVARLDCLRRTSRLDEAEAELPEAIARFPDNPRVWLQAAWLQFARFNPDRAAEALDRAEAVNRPSSHTLALPAGNIARERERLALLRRLPAIRAGKDQPRNDAERVDLAGVAVEAGWHAFAATLYAKALESDADVAQGKPSISRQFAARAAAVAGLGASRDQPPTDDAEKARLRAQALAWLRADLTAYTPPIKKGERNVPRRDALLNLQAWLHAYEFAAFRGPALEALPASEQAAWRAFWADVNSLLPGDFD